MWSLAEEHISARQRDTERVRAQENAALVERRILTGESSIDLQIQKTEGLIGRLTADRGDPSIIRMYEGHLRNLRLSRAGVGDDLINRKDLSISLTAIAVVLVEPAEPNPSPDTTASPVRAPHPRRSSG